MLSVLLTVLVVLIVCGIVAFLINRAPFIDEPFKSFAVWCIIAVAAIVIIVELVQLTGVHLG
jgi:amino acid transporter